MEVRSANMGREDGAIADYLVALVKSSCGSTVLFPTPPVTS